MWRQQPMKQDFAETTASQQPAQMWRQQPTKQDFAETTASQQPAQQMRRQQLTKQDFAETTASQQPAQRMRDETMIDAAREVGIWPPPGLTGKKDAEGIQYRRGSIAAKLPESEVRQPAAAQKSSAPALEVRCVNPLPLRAHMRKQI
jgi:hypothetical protein